MIVLPLIAGGCFALVAALIVIDLIHDRKRPR